MKRHVLCVLWRVFASAHLLRNASRSVQNSGGPNGSGSWGQSQLGTIGIHPGEQEPWVLRLCNAYAFGNAMRVYHIAGKTSSTPSEFPEPEKLTDESGPLPFKYCTDVPGVKLADGSIIDFHMVNGDLHVGSFSVTNLPPRASMLQLVIHRHDDFTTTADFTSHVFDDTWEPQVVVVDAYRGTARSWMMVRDSSYGVGQPLHYGTVVTLKPGKYEWDLYTGGTDVHPTNAQIDKKVSLEFEAHKKYTAIRVGADAIAGPTFPEDMVVFPDATVAMQGGALRRAVSPGMWLATFATVALASA